MQRKLDRHDGGPARWAVEDEAPVDGTDALRQPGEASAGRRVRASGAVVAYPQPQHPTPPGGVDGDPARAGVLDGVGQQLGRAVVGDGLDGRGRAVRRVGWHVDLEVHLHRAAGRECGQRGTQPRVQNRRVDAAGKVPQLDDGLLGAAMCRADQLPEPRQVDLGGCVSGGVELLRRQAQLHGQGDELRLGAVVEVAFDAAQLGRRVLDRERAGPLQVPNPAGRSGRAEQRRDQPRLDRQDTAQHPRRGQQHDHALQDEQEDLRPGVDVEVAVVEDRLALVPVCVAVTAAHVAETPQDRRRDEDQPVAPEEDDDREGHHRQRQRDQQVGPCPPGGAVADARADPSDEPRCPAGALGRLHGEVQQSTGQRPAHRAEEACTGGERGDHRQADEGDQQTGAQDERHHNIGGAENAERKPGDGIGQLGPGPGGERGADGGAQDPAGPRGPRRVGGPLDVEPPRAASYLGHRLVERGVLDHLSPRPGGWSGRIMLARGRPCAHGGSTRTRGTGIRTTASRPRPDPAPTPTARQVRVGQEPRRDLATPARASARPRHVPWVG
ncbi:hypothetical protein BCD48_13100 [Pseudofrankia sp. BMG5.36]|nr:hypothetical protein BCD48_13100 [Pseudofrankia sp. BMG5.36]